jgi:hypothetical protein
MHVLVRWFLIIVGSAAVLIGLFAPENVRDLAALFIAI